MPRFPGEERLVDLPGSPIRMHFDSAVPQAELALISESLQQAREDFGDSGPLDEQANNSNALDQGALLGAVAVDYLVGRFGDDKLKKEYWTAAGATGGWRAAFLDAFGISTDQFYSEFESYRKTL